MNIEFLSDFFVPVIAGICLCIGFMIRSVTDKLDRYIPCIVGGIGLLLALWMDWPVISLATLLMGLFSGLASTGLYEALKHIIKGE